MGKGQERAPATRGTDPSEGEVVIVDVTAARWSARARRHSRARANSTKTV
jgi:hypothetical protein